MMDAVQLSVLVIEDSLADAELVAELLGRSRRGGFRVAHEATLGDGVRRAASEAFDVVLLDFHLPDGQGPATVEAVRAVAPETPVIILTNLEDDEAAVAAVRAGAQDYLVKKSVDERLLVRAIRYAVEREQVEAARRRSDERYALVAEGAHDGIWDWDLRSGIVFYSSRWHRLLGLDEGEAGSDAWSWWGRVHAEDRPGLQAALDAHLAGDSEHFQQEHRIRTRDGAWRWVVQRGLAVRDGDGRAVRIAGSMTDVTARREAEARLVHDAMHDGLTGLPNRVLLADRLEQALRRRRRGDGDDCALIVLDLDRFKNVNDSLGHEAGDEMLVGAAARLSECVRPGDTVARLGGDEFGILLPDVGEMADATLVAQRVLTALAEPLPVGGVPVFTTASLGLALGRTGYHSPGEMIRDAEIAMYRAKAGGKNRLELFDEAMHANAVALLRLETELRGALDRGEFVMHYQPIVALGDGQLVGFEGLVRWLHPRRGMVAPARFIGVAEETGLIVPLGWWVLEAACRQLAAWQQRFPRRPALSMSANVSGKLFLEPDVVDRLCRLLETCRLDPGSLRLEITENVLMDHEEAALARLGELRALGVQLDIDDFGTGFSSLSYLQRFRYDTLKIDRSFISALGGRSDGATIVETLVALGKHLEMNVVAEGVETAEQARWLRDLRCPQGQGYWFARPADAAGVEQLLMAPAGGGGGGGGDWAVEMG